MQRIDKYLSNLGLISRKDSNKFFKNNLLLVNNIIIKNKDFKVNFGDIITFLDQKIEVLEHIYILLNKPTGYVSSQVDEGGHKSFKHLLKNCIYKDLLHVVGRIDFDTTGFLLLTNNGDFTHNIINPKKNIFKKYLVNSEFELSKEDINKLISGVIIDGEITSTAKVEVISKNTIYLSISQGKFHQVKKMFEAINNKVISLKRVAIGNLELGDLKEGEWRYLNQDEIKKLFC
ncbi:rRNA pseudouridine synthase [Candidatus Gracilibacteria bacterium]|nr:rRNA pseudouridine synthase [Candidatus Gracilibacteria bacterium]